MKVVYYPVYAIWFLMSLLPLRILYLLSDLLYYPLFYVVRYRRKIVRKNLIHSFPDKPLSELIQIEKQFYAFFCDCIVETIKQFTLSEKGMKRRMTFSGLDEMIHVLNEEKRNFVFIYLGHYCNWEWIASLKLWVSSDIQCGQIYHPLYNKAFDKLFLRVRSQYGGICIPMKETLRHIIELKRNRQKAIIGFISDQSPKWSSIHHFTPFLHQDTPVFTGTEKIGRQVNAAIFFADVTRPKRGYYHCHFYRLTDKIDELPEYQTTDLYMQQLEQMICRAPQYWLWTHNRWKRTKEEWLQRVQTGRATN